MNYIKGKTGTWEYVIGLEVHAQISARTKLFSGASAQFNKEPNSQVSLIDAAMPGMLPVLNYECVKQVVKTGLAINAKINQISLFDRKSYFYPDLPQGYQISQFYLPIIEGGYIVILTEQKSEKKIRINRIHLEQDAGKSVHDQYPNFSLIDLNRAGTGLMEIVTEPDLSSPYEAAEYIKKVRSLLKHIGSCNGNMEQGALRCDANVSVRKVGDQFFGKKCEIKNLNSIKNVFKAIEHEAKRQVEVIERKKSIDQETRLFDPKTGQTRLMRLKEDTNDYRYFPDPDLLPLHVKDTLIKRLRRELPELPDKKIKRYVKELGLRRQDAEFIVNDQDAINFFEEAIIGADPKIVFNWIFGELYAALNKYDIDLPNCKITPPMLRELVILIQEGTISGKMAKSVFEEMFKSGEEAKKIVVRKELLQITDAELLENIVDQIIIENSNSVIEYKNGKENLLDFFVGKVMKETKGRANPQILSSVLKKKLIN